MKLLQGKAKPIFTKAAAAMAAAFLCASCSLMATRPVQEIADSAAALRAAREVEAEVRAPELYREAKEYFRKAQRDYKFKYFKTAREYAERARILAEKAEFESLRAGAARQDGGSDEETFAPLPPVNAPAETASAPTRPEPYAYPTPEPKPASDNPELGANPIPAPLPVPSAAPMAPAQPLTPKPPGV